MQWWVEGLTVTGLPSMALDALIALLVGSNFARAASRPAVAGKIICRSAGAVSFKGTYAQFCAGQYPRHQTQQSDCRGAYRRFADTQTRYSSAHSRVPRLPDTSTWTIGTWPTITSPAVPFRVKQSPSFSTWSEGEVLFNFINLGRGTSCYAALTHATTTTAAWESYRER